MTTTNPHLIDGEFQSDKYPSTPRGKVPLSTKDKTAQDLLWRYAQRRRAIDAEFSDALESALQAHGFVPPPSADDLAAFIDQAALDLSGPSARATECEQKLRVLLVLAAARIRGMLDALQRALPFMESVEAKALVGDEGCLWPVEIVRAEIAQATTRPTSSTTPSISTKRPETTLNPLGTKLWSEPTR